MDTQPIEAFPLITMSAPNTPWQQAVDEIEDAFAPIYDGAEFGDNPTLAQMNRFDTRMVLDQTRQLKEMRPQLRVFDIGTGTGRIAMKLAREEGVEVVALDATREYLEIAAKKASRIRLDPAKIKFVQAPAEQFDFREFNSGEQFDMVTAIFGVMNHIEDWQGAIANIASSLNTGGKFVSTIYGTNGARVYKMRENSELAYRPSLVQTRVEGGIKLGDSAEILPAKFPSIEEYKEELERNDLKVEIVRGFLDLAACYPSEPSEENISLYKELISKSAPQLFEEIKSIDDPRKLLIEIIGYEETYANDPECLQDFAYVGFVARKV